jgi:hypothetical protein
LRCHGFDNPCTIGLHNNWPGHHCEASRRPSAQAIASASSADAQWNRTLHAVESTSPWWFLMITPTPASPVCSMNEPSAFSFVHPFGGASQCSFPAGFAHGVWLDVQTFLFLSHPPAEPVVGPATETLDN